MYLSKIEARNFRNYSSFNVVADRKINIIRGNNAQGKTNLIECLFYLLRGYSFRTKKDREILNGVNKWSSVRGEINTNNQKLSLQVDIIPPKKSIFLFGKKITKLELAQKIGVVLFTPDDLIIVKGAPRERRKFIDLELGSFLPGYLDNLKLYRQALEQRNNLLRFFRKERDEENLALWTEQLCRLGIGVLRGRLQILKDFGPLVCKTFGNWCGEDLTIKYRTSVPLNDLDTGQAQKKFKEEIEEVNVKEKKLGYTLVGPHRDDLSFFLNGRDIQAFASQGQQRSVVLALKLAQIELWKEYSGENPVVLLDDILFEFDQQRRNSILQSLAEGAAQVFITTGDNYFPGNRVFKVESGEITMEKSN